MWGIELSRVETSVSRGRICIFGGIETETGPPLGGLGWRGT